MSIKDWFQSKPKPDELRSHNTKTEDPPPDLTHKHILDEDESQKQQKNTTVTFDDIALGMQHAATAANRLIAHQYMQALEPFFDRTDAGSLQPKTVKMTLDDNHHFQLPLVALTTPRGLMLEKMKVFLTVCTESVDHQSFKQSYGDESPNRFIVSLSPSSRQGQDRDCSHVDVEMQFAALEPPEGMLRVIEEYTRRILPIPNTGD